MLRISGYLDPCLFTSFVGARRYWLLLHSFPWDFSQFSWDLIDHMVCRCEECGSHDHYLSAVVEKLKWELDSSKPRDESRPPSRFDSVQKPNIPVRDYIERFVHFYGFFEPATLVLMVIYFDRLRTSPPLETDICDHRLTHFNFHRMLAVSFTLAAKYLLDPCHVASNLKMSKIAGIDRLTEMNNLERYALTLLNYRLMVDSTEFRKTCDELGISM